SAISFAAVMLFFWASRPLVCCAPSYSITTAIPPCEFCNDIVHWSPIFPFYIIILKNPKNWEISKIKPVFKILIDVFKLGKLAGQFIGKIVSQRISQGDTFFAQNS